MIGLSSFLAFLDHLGQFEAVHAGHLDVQDEQRKFFGNQSQQRLIGRLGAHQTVARRIQHGLQHGEIFWLIIHNQNVDGLIIQSSHRGPVMLGLQGLRVVLRHATVRGRNWGRWNGVGQMLLFRNVVHRFQSRLTEQPDPQQRQQLFGIHGLGNIIARPGVETLFAVAFHCFRRERNNRE
jgi:hypothetical protein